MSTNELLFPRYKVISPWPGMEAEPFRLWQIVTLRPHKDDEGECFIHIPDKHMPGSYMRQGFFDKFPHLFKKLEWMDERPIEDMPFYVKHSGNVYQVDRWSGSFQNKCWVGCYLKGDGVNFIYSHELTPATLAEYEQYINKQKQTNETKQHDRI